jgi:prepilin-type processing-associated H-X9-DG protein
VPILPQIESKPTHDWYVSFKTGADAVAKNPSTLKIPTYLCASRGDLTTTSPLSYAVNAGTGCEVLDEALQFEGDGVFADAVGNLPGEPDFDASRPTYQPAVVSLKKVAVDGAGFTLLLTERSGPNAATDISWSANPVVVKANAGARVENHSVLHPLDIGVGSRTEAQVINPTWDTCPTPNPVQDGANGAITKKDWRERYPSSRHPGAVNVAFCDGRTRVLRNGIDSWVYCQLLSSNGKKGSPRVADWQQAVDASGTLSPYDLKPTDLVR